MIKLFEHHQYNKEAASILLTESQKKNLSLLDKPYCRLFKQKRGEMSCLNISFDPDRTLFNFETSYFVGVDWIIDNQQAVYVQPKLNKNEIEIDYLSMLFEAMQEPENFDHIEGLLDIDFNKPHIDIEQEIDILSPFLLIQFIQILRSIVRKGLKKSYYRITDNLEAKVKGKVLINATIKENILKNKYTRTICQYEEFGINNDENKILKKAFIFTKRVLLSYKGIKEDDIQHTVSYINPAFEHISDNINIDKLKVYKPNSLYKEYEQGLKLAVLILKRYSYNIQNTEQGSKIKTPPFWIDMSKLFELYVFKKLREIFPKAGELTYHLKTNRQELDFLLNHVDENGDRLQMVIDAKYKPRYENENIYMNDARQISGYARLKRIYKILNVNKNTLIDCLIVYSDTSDNFNLKKESLTLIEDRNYQNFYKVGIGLPQIENARVL